MSAALTFNCPMVLNLYTSFSQRSMFFPNTFWHFLKMNRETDRHIVYISMKMCTGPYTVIYRTTEWHSINTFFHSIPGGCIIIPSLHQMIDVRHSNFLFTNHSNSESGSNLRAKSSSYGIGIRFLNKDVFVLTWTSWRLMFLKLISAAISASCKKITKYILLNRRSCDP